MIQNIIIKVHKVVSFIPYNKSCKHLDYVWLQENLE